MDKQKPDELINIINENQDKFFISSSINAISRNYVYIGYLRTYQSQNKKTENSNQNKVENENKNRIKSQITDTKDSNISDKRQDKNQVLTNDGKNCFAIKLLPFYDTFHHEWFENEREALDLFTDEDPVIKPKMIVDVYIKGKHHILVAMKYYPKADLYSYLLVKINRKTHFLDPNILCVAAFRSLNLLLLLQKKEIVHNDFKFSNLIVTSEPPTFNLSITDFENSELVAKTKFSYMFGGTNLYNSPEVLSFKPHNFASDIWSLGICLHLFAFNCFPFEIDKDDNEYQILWKILNVKLVMPNHGPNAKEYVWECISKMLEVDFTKRITPEKALQLNWFKFIEVSEEKALAAAAAVVLDSSGSDSEVAIS